MKMPLRAEQLVPVLGRGLYEAMPGHALICRSRRFVIL